MQKKDIYPSNTYVGSCNNYIMISSSERTIRSRMLFRAEDAGRYNYRFGYCNAVDSTFSDGSVSQANKLGDTLTVESAYAGYCENIDDAAHDMSLTALTFGGSSSVIAEPGETIFTDPAELDIKAEGYIVFEWTVRGKNIPYTPDKMFPALVETEIGWRMSKECPQPFIVGCDRPVKGHIAFWGDSITQGLGTCDNKYEFWAAETGRRLPGYAVWNLGLGFARGADAATLGVWADKAFCADFVVMAFGVNDIFQCPRGSIPQSYMKLADALDAKGIRYGIVTVPPFDYSGDYETEWRSVCRFIREDLAPRAEFVLDSAPIWGMDPPYEHISRWYGHPVEPGGRLLAEKLAPMILGALEK